jgi:hypothetical protein
VPLVGLEPDSATSDPDSNLGQFDFQSDAKSGAVCREIASMTLTPDSLAAALLALPADDRACLAGMLTGEGGEGTDG